MKFFAALLVVAVGFALGFGTAHQWIASHPKPVAPEKMVAEVAPEKAPEPEPEPVREEPEPEPNPEWEPELVMVPETPEPVAEADPEMPAAPTPLPPLDFDSQDARIAGTSPELDSALATTLESDEWTAYRDHLRAALAGRFAKLNPSDLRDVDAAIETPLVRLVLSQERFLSKIPESVVRPIFAEDHAFATWLLGTPALLDAIYHHVSPSDDSGALLTFLGALHQEMADTLAAYTHLAVACGLVHDYGDSQTEGTKRFLWYVGRDQDGRLYRDIKTMPVADLVYVVDGVDLEQMDWVQAEYRRDVPRSKSGKVYSQIKYRMDLVTGDITRGDLYPEYTLAAIAESGGICADQAHFAANVCRAVGIPALNVSGSGNRGAHAWIRYQDDDGTWRSHGRYENYATGTFRDPQIRRDAIESALTIRSAAPFRSAARIARVQDRSLVADFLADSGDLPRGTEAAIQIAESESEYLPAWERVFALIEVQKERIAADSDAGLPEPNALTADRVVGIVKKFEIALRDQPDMLDRADDVLTETLDGILDDGSLLEILHRRRKRVETYDASRLDTILDLIRQEAAILARAGDFGAVTSLYRQELRSYGEDLQFFRKLAAAFWDISKESPARRDAALGLLNAEVNSNFERLLEGSDYFGKETAIGVYAQLRDYYREADNSGRADQLEKKIARAKAELKETKT